MRFALALLVLTACDESPFGTRHAEPGEAMLGRLVADNGGPDLCLVWSPPPPSSQMTGLGNGDFFYVANGNPSAPQLFAYEVITPGQSWQQHGNPVMADFEQIYDVAVRHGHCPYVSTVHHVAPAPFMSGNCQTSDNNYGRGPVVFAFDTSDNLYYAYKTHRELGIDPTIGQSFSVDPAVDVERITIKDNEVWAAYRINATAWEVLSFDKTTLKLKGHIAFPWPNADLAGMVWDPSGSNGIGNLIAIANQRTPAICSFEFMPATP